MAKAPPKKKPIKPNLDEFLGEKKTNYLSYAEGARIYSMNYYAFVALAKKAKANIRVKKRVVVNMDLVDAYVEEFCKGESDDAREK